MKRVAKQIVVTYRAEKGRPVVSSMRKAESEAAAVIAAKRLSQWHAGVAAYEVIVDEDDDAGEMHDPRELAVYGPVPDLEALVA